MRGCALLMGYRSGTSESGIFMFKKAQLYQSGLRQKECSVASLLQHEWGPFEVYFLRSNLCLCKTHSPSKPIVGGITPFSLLHTGSRARKCLSNDRMHK
jgi:hypothetical protein